MKVIYYSDWFKEYSSNIVIECAKSNIKVSFITRLNSKEFSNRRDDEHNIDNKIKSSNIVAHVIKGTHYSLVSLFSIIKIIFRELSFGQTIFHMQQTSDPRFIMAALLLPTIMTIHEPGDRIGFVIDNESKGLKYYLQKIIEKIYRKLSKKLIVHTVECMKQLSYSEQKKAVVIPHGISYSENQTLEENNRILYFGRYAKYKGVDVLIRSMELVWRKIPEARLKMLISPGDVDEKLEINDNRIDLEYGVYTNDRLETELNKSHVVCLPYLSGSGSGVLSKAHGSSKILVVTKVSDFDSYVDDKNLIAIPGDHFDLARALLYAIGGNPARKLEKINSWNEISKLHSLLYAEVLNLK